MWYSKDHVPVYTSQEWYTKIAKSYGWFHTFLNEWDRGLYQRFLPRDLNWLALLDLGCGDGRTALWFERKWLARYVGLDVAADLLRRAPTWVEKIVWDMEQPLPFTHDSFDIVICMYAILHIEQLDALFAEVRRVCKVGGRFIVQHHIERRPYIHHTVDGEAFKIVTYNHSYTDLEQAAEASWWTYDLLEIDERHGGGRIYCFS